MKPFRAPGSFGYKRMLPYLTDLANDNTSTVEILHCQNHPIKSGKSMVHRPLLLNVDPSSKSKDCAVGSANSPTAQSSVDPDLAINPVFKNPKLKYADDVAENLTTKSFDWNQAPPENFDPEFEPHRKSFDSPSVDHKALSVEELAGAMQANSYCRSVMSTSEMDRKLSLGASQIGKTGHLASKSLAPKKVILKRHTRGCRGICMCLDCVSFRIHAEKAFEFSRKQVQEADEVVTELMKELSVLRSLVERSTVPKDDNSKNYAALQLNQDRRKLFVEDL